MESIKPALNIIIVGRTGAGKSALCNKISRTDSYKEGHSAHSETQNVSSITITWPHNTELRVALIDTPGFADNGPNVTNHQLISRILGFISSLEDGLNIVLFCVNAKDRFDAHDTAELDMLGLLLGSGLYEHLYIVVTQGNTLKSEKRDKIYEKFKEEVPSILEEHGLPHFPEEKILFADFDKFDEFLQPLTGVLERSEVYRPDIAADLNVDDEESIARFLQTPQMKKIMEEYERKNEEQKASLIDMQNIILEQKNSLAQTIEDNRKKQESIQKNIDSLNKALSDKENQSVKLKQDLEMQKQQQVQELKKVREDFEKNNEKQKAEIIKMQSTHIEQQNALAKTIEKNRKEQESIQNNFNSLNQALLNKNSENTNLKQELEKEKQRQVQELNNISTKLNDLSKRNEFIENQLKLKNDGIENLCKKVDELKKFQKGHPGNLKGGCKGGRGGRGRGGHKTRG